MCIRDRFKVFLKKELGHRNGHVNHCLCWLNRLIYIAVDLSLIHIYMEGYKHRIMDGLLAKKLQAQGAVLIEGPKW